MRATGIVRRIDELGRVVIPKEIRRTLRIREGDPSLSALIPLDRFCAAMIELAGKVDGENESRECSERGIPDPPVGCLCRIKRE